MSKNQAVEQTKLAFQFIEKLYFEVSYFIKEVEGLLFDQDEELMMGRPSGYGITTRSSTGLEANQVVMWPMKKLAVFFVKKDKTTLKGGTTNTKFDKDLNVIYLRIVLHDKELSEPVVMFGVLYDFVKKNPLSIWPEKFEKIMGHIEYAEHRVFGESEKIFYDHDKVSFRGELRKLNLYDIHTSEDIHNLVVKPVLHLYDDIATRDKQPPLS
jgi:hypothetical protein